MDSIKGVLTGFDGQYIVYMRDDKGYDDHVTMRQGTQINPTGIKLTEGMRVTIYGYANGSTFDAYRIDVAGPDTTSYGYGNGGDGGYYPGGYGYPGYGYGYPYGYGYGYPWGWGVSLGLGWGWGWGGYYGGYPYYGGYGYPYGGYYGGYPYGWGYRGPWGYHGPVHGGTIHGTGGAPVTGGVHGGGAVHGGVSGGRPPR
jgi:hypothetical protein